MNYKQLYFENNMKSVNITSYGNNGNSNPEDITSTFSDAAKFTESQLMIRLKELEDSNTELSISVKEQKRKLAETIATNTRFLSIIGHDLRNPISSIIGILDLMKESINENNFDELEKYIRIGSEAATNTFSLLDNLLAWTIAQNKEKSFNPVKINLYELITPEIESMKIFASRKLISLNQSVASDIVVTVDILMAKTIIRNLLSNAIKFTNMGGEVTVGAIQRDKFVEIDVTDNGIGLSQNAQRDLFDMNEIHSTPGTENEHGTGLGLLLCKKFVEIHGGIIWIESEAGKGSKFRFTLPYDI